MLATWTGWFLLWAADVEYIKLRGTYRMRGRERERDDTRSRLGCCVGKTHSLLLLLCIIKKTWMLCPPQATWISVFLFILWLYIRHAYTLQCQLVLSLCKLYIPQSFWPGNEYLIVFYFRSRTCIIYIFFNAKQKMGLSKSIELLFVMLTDCKVVHSSFPSPSPLNAACLWHFAHS